MKRVLRQIALVTAVAACSLPALAAPGLLSKFVSTPAVVEGGKAMWADAALINYSDAWWVPSENGWGVNALQQGDTLVLMFYVYDDDDLPVWFRGVTTKVADNDFRGTIYLDRGTSYREAQFGPIPMPSQAVGEVRFQASSLYDAVLTYTIGSTTAAKALTRLAFTSNDYGGGHATVVSASISACGDKSGELIGSLQSEASITNGHAQLTMSGQGTTCVINGPFSQRGKLGQISAGSYSCSDGSSGQASVDGWDTQGGSFSAIVTTSSGICAESGRIAGVRIH